MKTKSMADMLKQAERIRAGYGWKARGDKWDYTQFQAIAHKVNKIVWRYMANIGQYQRYAEGMTREEQDVNFDEIMLRQYPAPIYTKQPE